MKLASLLTLFVTTAAIAIASDPPQSASRGAAIVLPEFSLSRASVETSVRYLEMLSFIYAIPSGTKGVPITLTGTEDNRTRVTMLMRKTSVEDAARALAKTANLEIQIMGDGIVLRTKLPAVDAPLEETQTPLSLIQKDIRSIASQLELYRQINHSYPSNEQGLKALVDRPTTVPMPRNWTQLMQYVPKDYWGRPYVYRTQGPPGKEGFELKSLGADGSESTDDISH